MKIELEVCIGAGDITTMCNDIDIAKQGGAHRIELCADMANDGITPSAEACKAARAHFQDGCLLRMIRPRAGNFDYNTAEFETCIHAIEEAKETGCDGVVIGMLQSDFRVDSKRIKRLVQQAKRLALEVTFHRAFDALAEPTEGINVLCELGVDRLLTSGTPWGSNQSALNGVAALKSYVQQSKNKLELVVGGGVNTENAAMLLDALVLSKQTLTRLSFHTYSGVMSLGKVDIAKVRYLRTLIDKYN